MKRLSILLGTVLVSLPAVAQVSNITSVAWEKVPPVVQQAIQASGGATAISKVERGVENGQAIYSVALPGSDTRVVVRENGTPVPVVPVATAQPIVAPVPEPEPVATNELPEGVTQQTVNGQTVYNVVSEGNIQASQVQVTPDARVLSTTQIGPQGVVQMQKIPRSSVPEAVENSIQTQTGPGQIVDVVQGSFNDQTVYDVVYDQGTQRIKLRLDDKGYVLAQSIISTEDSRVIDVEPWIGYKHIPVAVQTTLAALAGDHPIESVRQEVVNERVTFVGVYRNDDGAPVSVRVSQTGQLLR